MMCDVLVFDFVFWTWIFTFLHCCYKCVILGFLCVNKDGCRRQYGKHDQFKFWTVLLMGFCVFTLKLSNELFEKISPQVPPPLPNGSAHTTTRPVFPFRLGIVHKNAWTQWWIVMGWGCAAYESSDIFTDFQFDKLQNHLKGGG
jgi:hypothetical protein